jgi:hypothetical protein
MRCPYCNKENEEAAEYCVSCGKELPQHRSQWRGPEVDSTPTRPSDVAAASAQWDPARRPDKPQAMSAFVPPANYTPHLSWILTVLIVGTPATIIHAILFYRGVLYTESMGLIVAILTICCLPIGILALLFTSRVRAQHTLGKDARAYRYSRFAGLCAWISMLIALALYVVLFLRLMYNIGQFWGY